MAEKRVLKDVEGKLIKEDNKLITATANMSPLSQKLFEIAVAAIDPNSEDVNTVRIDKELIFKSLELEGVNRNNRLTSMLSNLSDDASFVYTEIDHGARVDVKIKPVYQIKNNYRKPYSEVSFAPEIMPLLVELHNKFTKYPLSDILKMKGKYSIPLYRWFMLGFNQYEYYSKLKERTREQLSEYLTPRIDIIELRKLTGTEDKYKDWRNFKKYVIEIPIAEINKYSERLSVEWSPIRAGRKVVGIQFDISKKYVDEVEENIDSEKLYSDSANSKYTLLLITNQLLSPIDISNRDLIIGIGETLYPRYDNFADKYGFKQLEKHIQYLGKNKPKKVSSLELYLSKAIDNYVAKLESDSKDVDRSKKTNSSVKNRESLPDWENEKPKKYNSEEKNKLNADIDRLFRELGSVD
ncbi:replication initiation protein [Lactobacillus taiwanensis]|uniref:replication initiation protein n=1 Tax=Lactobacillus taiwanensis TaxID=508451 RepID=UPI00321FDB38